MFPYIILLLIGIIAHLPLAVKKNIANNSIKYTCSSNIVLQSLFFSFCTLLFGLRFGVGTDYNGYISMFERIGENNQYLKDRLEPGYYYLNLAVHDLGLNANYVLLISYGISLYFIYKFILKNSKNQFFSVSPCVRIVVA